MYFAHSHTKQRPVCDTNHVSWGYYCNHIGYSENVFSFLSCIKIKINSGVYPYVKTYRIILSRNNNDFRSPHSYLKHSLPLLSFEFAKDTTFRGYNWVRTSKKSSQLSYRLITTLKHSEQKQRLVNEVLFPFQINHSLKNPEENRRDLSFNCTEPLTSEETHRTESRWHYFFCFRTVFVVASQSRPLLYEAGTNQLSTIPYF